MIKRLSSIFIIGSGQLARDCTKAVYLITEKVPFVIEYASQLSLRPVFEISKYKIQQQQLDKFSLTKTLLSAPSGSIIISVGNFYIFPKEVVQRDDLQIINYHAALLPKHPGRNPEAWAIFEQDAETGVTWHIVTSDIDRGPIIARAIISLTDKTTSLSLMIEQRRCAFQLFKSFLPSLLDGSLKKTPQENDKSKLHYSYEIPGNGILDFSWPGKKISSFLRAMDYGSLHTLGRPKANLGTGDYFTWESYLINPNKPSITSNFPNYEFIKDGILFRLLNCQKVEDEDYENKNS